MRTKVIRGKQGENLAAEYLEKKGYTIIEKNWRYSRLGEIDIIARDGSTLVFIEVKTRTSQAFGHPIEAITPQKLHTLQKLAEIYRGKNATGEYDRVRLDVIGILTGATNDITHIEGVF